MAFQRAKDGFLEGKRPSFAEEANKRRRHGLLHAAISYGASVSIVGKQGVSRMFRQALKTVISAFYVMRLRHLWHA